MKLFFQAFRLFLILTVLTGGLYPLAVTALAQWAFPYQANGSLIKEEGKLIGSELLAQKFTSDRYFWSRPSAADFATVASGASNQGPTNAALKEKVIRRIEEFKKAHPSQPVPSEMVFASGSGLDPHISPEAARSQVERVARARNRDAESLYPLVDAAIEPPQFGFLGKPRVNIFRLNRSLD